MKNMFEEIKNKVIEWGKKDWEMGSKNGVMKTYNNYGIVINEWSKEDYFEDLNNSECLYDLECWYCSLVNCLEVGEFSLWLDRVLKGE